MTIKLTIGLLIVLTYNIHSLKTEIPKIEEAVFILLSALYVEYGFDNVDQVSRYSQHRFLTKNIL